MANSIRKFFLLFSILFLSNMLLAQTAIRNFEQLLASLKAGNSVKTVIYYGKCKLFVDGKEEAKSPDAIGGMKIDTYEYFDSSVFKGRLPSFLSASQTVLISHPHYGYVYNYVKLKIKMDNSVEITARYLKPRKFSSKFRIVMDETFKGKIDDGNNAGGVSFFSE